MDSQVAAVAKDDGIGVFTFSVITDGACNIFPCIRKRCTIRPQRNRHCFGRYPFYQVEPLFLQAVDNNLKHLVRNSVQLVSPTLQIQRIEPLLILLVHVILDLLVELALNRLDVSKVMLWLVELASVIEAKADVGMILHAGRHRQLLCLMLRDLAEGYFGQGRSERYVVRRLMRDRHDGCWLLSLSQTEERVGDVIRRTEAQASLSGPHPTDVARRRLSVLLALPLACCRTRCQCVAGIEGSY